MKQASIKRARSGVSSRNPSAAKQGPEQAVREPWLTTWTVAVTLVLVTVGLLRLLFLDVKPLHHDEGVNGFFLTNLFRTGFYHYDPANYHGPSLYYFGLITTTLNALFYGKAGLSTFAIRLVPAVFGIALIWLVLLLRRQLGNFGAPAAAALLAVSPGMVYFSRYFIHEVPFVFLTLALVVTAWRYRETGQPRYLMLASASAAMMFATKETCIISFVVLILAWLCARFYLTLRNEPGSLPSTSERRAKVKAPEVTQRGSRFQLFATAALLFIAIGVLFFSSFFTNFPKGVLDSLRTFQIWTHTGVQTNQYRAPWWTYFDWLGRSFMEPAILALGALGIIVALWKGRDRFAVFTAFWALGITAAYCIVPYKTPWLALNLILPLAIMAGYGLDQWYGSGGWTQQTRSRLFLRLSSGLVFLAALVFSASRAVDLSFYHYDENSWPYVYVYAHTSRQLLDLVHDVQAIAARSPSGNDTGMTVVSAEYWPLPWYLRDYPRAIFWGHMIQTSEPILIASGLQTEEVDRDLGRLYRVFKAYDLRPGNLLVLYLRRDIQP